MTLETACTFANRLDRRVGIMIRDGQPVFYFQSRLGFTVTAPDGPTIKAALAEEDAA